MRGVEEMQVVRELLDEGYCDVTGRTGDLDHGQHVFNFVVDFLIPLQRQFHRQMGGIKGLAGPGKRSSYPT
jgi:hypothetical protein